MKHLVFFLLIIGSSFPCMAQQWQPESPGLLPINYGLFDVDIVNDSVIWAVSYDRTASIPVPTTHITKVLRSIDAGASWQVFDVDSARGRISYDIEAFGPDTAFITTQDLGSGAGRGIFRTTDGGNSWEEILNDVAGGVWIRFFDRSHAVIINRELIQTSSDGGDTWTPVAAGNIPAFFPSEFTLITSGNGNCKIVGDRHIWFGTNAGRVYRSNDKGNTWSVSSAGLGSNAGVYSIAFSDTSLGIAIDATASPVTFSTTTNGGVSWSPIASNANFQITNIYHIPGSFSSFIGTGITSGGNISAITKDFGMTWKIFDSSSAVRGFDIISEDLAWGGESVVSNSQEETFYRYNRCGVTSSNDIISSCNDYTWPVNGQTYSIGGAFQDTLLDAEGCDSIVTLFLTLSPLSNEIEKEEDTLTATVSGAVYQWVDCAQNVAIAGANSQSFTPEQSGEYAVVVTTAQCTDTSDCVNLFLTNLEEDIEQIIQPYPNPVDQILSIHGDRERCSSYELYSISGQLLGFGEIVNQQINMAEMPAGLYLLSVYHRNGTYTGSVKVTKR